MRAVKEKIKIFIADMRALLKLQPFIFLAMLFSMGYGTATIIIGSVKLSYFIGIAGACALILGGTKFYALKKYAEALRLDAEQSVEIQAEAAKNIAMLASVIAFLHFSIAVVCAFFEEENPANYGFGFLFFTAGVSLVNIVLSAISALRTRKNHNIIIHHVKLINTANALIGLGLTQRAILYYVGDAAARLASGIGGMFFSLCALFVCLTMFLKYKAIKS